MYLRINSIILSTWLSTTACGLADIVWSGEQNQRAYHDIASIDLNQDGTTDFVFSQTVPSNPYKYYHIIPHNGQLVVEQNPHTLDADLLLDGTRISANMDNPNYVWDNSETLLFYYTGGMLGYGGLVDQEGYLGISFDVEGSIHFGWIEVSHYIARPSPGDEFLYVHGWAYESTPDTPIMAGAIPEPSSGILTLIGSLGILLISRARRRGKQGCGFILSFRIRPASTVSDEW